MGKVNRFRHFLVIYFLLFLVPQPVAGIYALIVRYSLNLIAILCVIHASDEPSANRRSHSLMGSLGLTLLSLAIAIAIDLAISTLVAPLLGSPQNSVARNDMPNETIADVISILILCALTGFSEELFYRRWLISVLIASESSPLSACLFQAIAFALPHWRQGPTAILTAALVGMCFGLLYLRYKDAHSLAWAHAAHNAAIMLSA